MKNSYKLASITMLCSLLLLSACHKNETKSDSNDHSTVKTAQSSSKKAKSSKAKKKMTANASSNKKAGDSTQSAASEQMSPAQSSTTQPSSSATNADSNTSPAAEAKSTVDVNALASGDFSTISGTWSNDLGKSITINSNGKAAFAGEKREYGLTSEKIVANTFWGTIYPKDAQVGGAAFIVVPAGVADPVTGQVSNTDRILSGQDENANTHHCVAQ